MLTKRKSAILAVFIFFFFFLIIKEIQYLDVLQTNKNVSTMDVVIPVALKDKVKLKKACKESWKIP
jgi:hypothetical protein